MPLWRCSKLYQRTKSRPQNLSLLRKIVLTVTRADKTDPRKDWLQVKRKEAAWDDGARERMQVDSLNMLDEFTDATQPLRY